jgi:acyl dehydratase
MATTNLQQWNPTAVNQETDAAYLADSQRAGGATNPSEFDATLANKLFYQCTTYLDGLFSAFAAKGFTTSDSSLSTLTAQCANFLTTADVLPNVVNVTYAASVTLNAASANGFYLLALTGNLTIAAVTGLNAGQPIALYYQQDGVGGRTVAFPSSVLGAAQPDPVANAVSLQLFGYDAVTGYLRAAGPLVSSNGAWFPAAVSVAGVLTAPTPSAGDNSTKTATTAWSRLGLSVSLSQNGYIILPAWLGGVTVQWGVCPYTEASAFATQAFPTPFSNNCFAVVLGQAWPSGQNSSLAAVRSVTLSSFYFGMANVSALNGGAAPYFVAIGN